MVTADDFVVCLCGDDNYHLVLQNHEFSYVKCNRCGLIYQNPRPSLEDINKIYGEDYFDYELSSHEAFFQLMKLGLHDIQFDLITKNFFNPKRILDIGCATGLLLNHLHGQGWQPHGVEICQASATYAKSHFNLDILTKPLEQCHFQDNFFQVIHFSHLIEHVPNPKTFLQEVYRILQPGGYIIVTTPNVNGLFAKFFKEEWRSAIPQHLFLFSKYSLSNILSQSRFEILKQVSWGGIPIEKSKGVLKKWTDKWVKKLNLGDVMLFLAIKPSFIKDL